MEPIPKKLQRVFEQDLQASGRDAAGKRDGLKWLRFYLDFCKKYDHPPRDANSLEPFLSKLASKRQSTNRQEDAAASIGVFYRTVSQFPPPGSPASAKGAAALTIAEEPAPCTPWDAANQELIGVFAVRQLARTTRKTYRAWVLQFQCFAQDRTPDSVSAADAAAFLTHLAVERKVGASAQNQAFNALLFFYRHVLQKDFDLGDTVTRAKRRKYIPQILSQEEIAQIVREIGYPYSLVTQVLYGCGLRLAEALSLRVQNFDFDQMVLTIRRGKGGKDRTVPIPETLRAPLLDHLERVKSLFEEDLAHEDFLGAFMPEGSPIKWLPRSKDLPWQFFFPAKTLTLVPEEIGYRRYHLHATHFGKRLKRTVRKLKLTKRVTAHTFRHSFASHLLLANYDIRTVQVMLGHSDVKTTMIYTQTVPSRTLKEQKSPLDLSIETRTT